MDYGPPAKSILIPSDGQTQTLASQTPLFLPLSNICHEDVLPALALLHPPALANVTLAKHDPGLENIERRGSEERVEAP